MFFSLLQYHQSFHKNVVGYEENPRLKNHILIYNYNHLYCTFQFARRILHITNLLSRINSFKNTKEFCSLLEVETPINISFPLHFFRADNVLVDIVLSLCNKVPSKSNKRSLHFFISFFPFHSSE